MNNIFSMHWFQSDKSCVIRSRSTNTVAHLCISCGAKYTFLHRSVGAKRFDWSRWFCNNSDNSFKWWFLKGGIKRCLVLLGSWTMQRSWLAGEGKVYAAVHLMEELALLFYTRSSNKSSIHLLPFASPVLCFILLSLLMESNVLCLVAHTQLLRKALKKNISPFYT